MRSLILIAVFVLVSGMVSMTMMHGQGPTTTEAVTVESQYPGLSSGPLRQAVLTNLQPGTVLRSGTVVITAQQVQDALKQAKPDVQSQLAKNQFFLLEQRAIQPLLLAEARAWARAQGRPIQGTDSSLVQAYQRSLTEGVTVSDAEVRQYYQENQAMLGNAPFDAVKDELRNYLLDQKRQDAARTHTACLSGHCLVEVDATWTQTQAATALDNPVDRARRAGIPALVDFGRGGCQACNMMVPVLDSLTQEAAGRYSVLFIHVGENPILAARYGIEAIPAQVIFDKDGHEVFRHIGYIPKDQLVTQLAKLGVR